MRFAWCLSHHSLLLSLRLISWRYSRTQTRRLTVLSLTRRSGETLTLETEKEGIRIHFDRKDPFGY